MARSTGVDVAYSPNVLRHPAGRDRGAGCAGEEIRGFHPERRNASVSCASRFAAASAAADCLASCCAALALGFLLLLLARASVHGEPISLAHRFIEEGAQLLS